MLKVIQKLYVVGEQPPSVDLYIAGMQKNIQFNKITLFSEFMEIYAKIADKSVLNLDYFDVFKYTFVSYKSAFAEYFSELTKKGQTAEEDFKNTKYVIHIRTYGS